MGSINEVRHQHTHGEGITLIRRFLCLMKSEQADVSTSISPISEVVNRTSLGTEDDPIGQQR